MNNTKKSKPSPFLWGAATSAHQIEGDNIHSDWWKWEHEGNIEGGVISGSATDHWNRYKEDIRLAAELGLNSYRFSIEWAKIEPEQGRFSKEALEWYHSLILECEKNKLLPMATLHHFTSPQWFSKLGGFSVSKSSKAFLAYVEKVASSFGSRVPIWCTINEPMVLAVGSYLGGFMPPAKYSPQKVAPCCINLLKAHARAYQKLHSLFSPSRREGPWADRPLEVGIAQNMVDFIPNRKSHPVEWVLSKVFNRFYNLSFLEAVTGGKQRFGIPGLVPGAPSVKRIRGKKICDYIGVNYYTKAYVCWKPKEDTPNNIAEIPIGLAFARRKEEKSDLGWAIHPDGFSKMIEQGAQFNLPLYITENGIADRKDVLRPRYIKDHLIRVANGIRDGVDIRGYYYWSLLDNFEWIKGFGPRFGLYSVDYATFERSKTKSASFLQKIIKKHHEGPPDSNILQAF